METEMEDDDEVFSSVPDMLDVCDTIWVLFVLAGYVPPLPPGILPRRVLNIKGAQADIQVLICSKDTEYVHFTYFNSVRDRLEKIMIRIYDLLSNPKLCGTDIYSLTPEEKVSFYFCFVNFLGI